MRHRPGKNSYTAWNEAGREQNSLINYILGVDCHTIVTMRSKMEYAMELNERGKQQPVKIGLAPVQRDDTEYEFDIVMNIGRDHIATTSKDVTFLDGFGAVITPELGRRLRAWLADGKEPERWFCADCGARIRDSARGAARAPRPRRSTLAARCARPAQNRPCARNEPRRPGRRRTAMIPASRRRAEKKPLAAGAAAPRAGLGEGAGRRPE